MLEMSLSARVVTGWDVKGDVYRTPFRLPIIVIIQSTWDQATVLDPWSASCSEVSLLGSTVHKGDLVHVVDVDLIKCIGPKLRPTNTSVVSVHGVTGPGSNESARNLVAPPSSDTVEGIPVHPFHLEPASWVKLDSCPKQMWTATKEMIKVIYHLHKYDPLVRVPLEVPDPDISMAAEPGKATRKG